jgi:hypothetical protein
MTSQFGATANLDGSHGPKMPEGQLMGFTVSWSKGPEDIGHF